MAIEIKGLTYWGNSRIVVEVVERSEPQKDQRGSLASLDRYVGDADFVEFLTTDFVRDTDEKVISIATGQLVARLRQIATVRGALFGRNRKPPDRSARHRTGLDLFAI